MSMPQKLFCPHCRGIVPYEVEHIGDVRDCPLCGRSFRIPTMLPQVDVPTLEPATSPDIPPRPIIPPATADDPLFTPLPQGMSAPPQPREPYLDEPFEPDRRQRRRRRGQVDEPDLRDWNHIPQGLALCQIGLVLVVAVLLIGLFSGHLLELMSSGPRTNYGGVPYNSYNHYRSDQDYKGYLCGTLLGMGFFLIGQIICCSGPKRALRGSAVVSTLLLIIVALMLFYKFAENNDFSLEGMLVCSGLLFGLSHLLFVLFLRNAIRHFRDADGLRAFTYYLLILAFAVVCVFLFFCIPRSHFSVQMSGQVSLALLSLLVLGLTFLANLYFFLLLNRLRKTIQETLRNRPL